MPRPCSTPPGVTTAGTCRLTDPYVLDCSYHAGHAYAQIGKPVKALAHLRFYVQNANSSTDEDNAAKILESRFVIAQMLSTAGHFDEALLELEAIRPLLAANFGAEFDPDTQPRQADRSAKASLRNPTENQHDFRDASGWSA